MDGAVRSPNRLLANLSPADFELVESHLRTFELVQAIVVAEAGDELKDAYFPHSGVISQFLAQMLGVKRNVVSLVAGTLRDKGIVRIGRGQIRIIDAERLKASACESMRR